MKTWKAILGVLTVFFMGAAFGAMLAGKLVELRVRAVIDAGPDQVVHLIERRLAQELELTTGQRKLLRPVLETSQSRIRTVRSEASPEILRILEETRIEVRAMLTPEQVRIYDAMVEDARRQWFGEAASNQ